ncbi:MAG TPA: phenylalanine--tRNA ligase subunit beta, partial [Anaerolineae bacterium]|nr:phenylalanine--tRNA ligase subunit beta [Anaerolineae bacterium]
MQFPLSWLKEYVDISLPPAELAELMTMAGMEVNHLTYIGLPEADLPWDREKLVLGHILRVEQHPNADRLVLATVDIGAAEPETVVTGAPNLFPYIGQGDISGLGLKSPFVMEGATVYDGHAKEPGKKMKLKGRKVRGIMNRHMLCSEKELGISDEHEGIILMQSDFPPGAPLVDVMGDVIFEFDILPNIARTTAIIGIAREVAALTGRKLRLPDFTIQASGPSLKGRLQLKATRPDLNPRFVAVLVEGIQLKPSPYWMQLRLRLAVMRPINNVVDVSNYVMLEVGQPNHAFDWDLLRQRAAEYAPQGPVKLITRLALPDEKLVTLDDETRQMPPSAMMVTDPKSALSIGGIMGGASSEVQDNSQNILIEAAAWNFINIRQTATALKLHSEAGYRFSRGVHPSLAMWGALRAAKLIQQLAGGQIAQDLLDYYPLPAETITLDLSVSNVTRLLGVALSLSDIKGYLEALEFTCEEIGADRLRVTAPDHRLDISADPVIGRADLIEEIARMVGYHKIPVTELSDVLPPQRNNTALDRENRLKDLLTEVALQEVITYRLTTPQAEARLLAAAPRSEGEEEPLYVRLVNPSSSERVVMRRSLLNSALEIAAANSRFTERIRLFEVGHIYLPQAGERLPLEQARLAIVITGPREEAGWQGADTTPVDFFDLKGILESVLKGLHVGQAAYRPVSNASYYPGRAAEVSVGDTLIGVLGEIHPAVVAAYNLPEGVPVLAADLDLDALLALVKADYRVKLLPRFPAVQQDIALVVDEAVTAASIEAEIRKAGGFLLSDVRLFDIYRGEQLGAGKKNMAYSLWFQSPTKTLTDKV